MSRVPERPAIFPWWRDLAASEVARISQSRPEELKLSAIGRASGRAVAAAGTSRSPYAGLDLNVARMLLPMSRQLVQQHNKRNAQLMPEFDSKLDE
jgi:hypothetical protein